MVFLTQCFMIWTNSYIKTSIDFLQFFKSVVHSAEVLKMNNCQLLTAQKIQTLTFIDFCDKLMCKVKCILKVSVCQIKQYREKIQCLEFNIVNNLILKNKYVIKTSWKDRLKICTEEKNKIIVKMIKAN